MNSFAIREGIVWVALVALTLVGFFNYEPSGTGSLRVALVAGFLKFFLIFYDFMEMKHAHRIWLVTMGVFVLVLFGAISLILSGR